MGVDPHRVARSRDPGACRRPLVRIPAAAIRYLQGSWKTPLEIQRMRPPGLGKCGRNRQEMQARSITPIRLQLSRRDNWAGLWNQLLQILRRQIACSLHRRLLMIRNIEKTEALVGQSRAVLELSRVTISLMSTLV